MFNLSLSVLEIENEIQKLRNKKQIKKVWMRPSNPGYFEVIVPQQTDAVFMENMRINRKTFHYILSIVGQDMKTINTNMRNAVPIDKKLAVALTVLSTNCEYKEVGKIYGIGKTTVHTCFKLFIKSAIKHLVQKHIKLPTKDEFKLIASEFEQRWQYPMAIGCIDGSHFPIQAPVNQSQDYYNYKGWHSMIALAICDANYKVYYVKTGIPGRCNDSGAFSRTDIYNRFDDYSLLPESSREFNNIKINYHLLGDSAFQLKPWLLKPYLFSTELPSDQVLFNKRHSRARRVIENVFGRVKARWRRLRKTMEFKIEDIGLIISVAFALNNICEDNKIRIDPRWVSDKQNDHNYCQPIYKRSDKFAEKFAKDSRNGLKEYFNSQSIQPWE